MQCMKCGKMLDNGVLFCPFCGEKVSAGTQQQNDTPLYQAEVKGLLKSGKLIIYRDRTEFIMSKVQKMVLPYASLVALKKGLDRINFIMDDGRTESCAVNTKNIHEAFYIIEQASRPYIAERNSRLQSEGIRYSFPSSRSGISGMLNNGLLNVLDDRSEYLTPSGKNEVISYQDVKAVRISPMGALEFSQYDGTKRAFTVDKELRDEVAAFYQTALAPFIEERKARLLSQGIYFSFLNNQGFNKGVLNIFEDRLEYKAESGQEEIISFQDIRLVRVSGSSLEAALTNGTSKTFQIDRDSQNEVLSFLNAAIAPYIEKRTKGFDTSFGLNERLELNESRGVFHVIRQGGKEISGEYNLQDIVKAEAIETKASQNIVSSLLAARGGDTTSKSAEERIMDIGILLTVRTDQGTGNVPVCFSSFSFGVSRTSPDYERCREEQSKFFSYMETRHPDCELMLPPPAGENKNPGAGPEASEAASPENSENLSASSMSAKGSPNLSAGIKKQESGAANIGAVEKGQFGTLVDGISDYVEKCGTPMTIAIQGDWETGSGSFLRIIYNNLEESYHGNIFWLYTWQFSQFDLGDQLPMLLADKLIELLGGAVNEAARTKAKMLAQGVIGIASGLISQGTSDGQKLTDALFNKDNIAKTMEQKVRFFTDMVRRKAGAGNGKVVFFVDDLNRLAPVKVAALLDAMRNFFDCPDCVFMIAVNRETVIQGKRELDGAKYDEEKGATYFERVFKMAFRVPKNSLDVHKYVMDNLNRVNICTDDEEEARHYGELASLSIGSDPKALERLFNSFLLLKSLAGEEAFSSRSRRLILFALLCMQNRFSGVYRCLVQMKHQLTTEVLSGLATGSVIEEQAGLSEAEGQSFRAFMAELFSSINTGESDGLTDQDCMAFSEALNISAITSSN